MKRILLLVALLSTCVGVALSARPALGETVDLVVSSEHQAAYYGIGTSQYWLDGTVQNLSTTTNVTDVVVHATAHRGDGSSLTTYAFPADTHVLPIETNASFNWPITLPIGTVYWTFTASGSSTPVWPYVRTTGFTLTTDPSGLRHVRINFVSAPETISSVIAAGREYENAAPRYPPDVGAFFLGSLSDRSRAADVMPAGAAYEFNMPGRRAIAYPYVLPEVWAEYVAYTPHPFYRFYNRRNGSYFYTANEAEKERVRTTASSTFTLEGTSYQVNSTNPSNMRPLYRFYNRRNGSYFYTANEAEKERVRTTAASIFTLEGIADSVSTFPWFSQPVYRFYNRRNGSYFYTANEAEKERVRTTAASTYTLEGVAYYVAF